MDLNETITKLTDSMNQYSATALINIKLPNFAGLPDQDINQFIREFKAATCTLNDELKCLALDRSLIGAAHIWAKTNIKDDIKAGQWIQAKKKLRERFTPSNEALKHLDRLAKMKYDSAETTLSSYVEVYADVYRKAYQNASDGDVIRGLRLNFSPEILRHLNILSDSWTDMSSFKDFMAIIHRIERNVLPYEVKPKTEDSANMLAITDAIKELRQTLLEKKTEEKKESTQTEEVIAAISRPNQYQRNGQFNNKRRYYDNNNQRPENDRYKRRYNSNQGADNKAGGKDDTNGYQTELDRQYEERHGRVPSPCSTCGAKHFHRHCPHRALN